MFKSSRQGGCLPIALKALSSLQSLQEGLSTAVNSQGLFLGDKTMAPLLTLQKQSCRATEFLMLSSQAEKSSSKAHTVTEFASAGL